MYKRQVESPKVFKLLRELEVPRICFYHLVYSGRGSEMIKEDLNHAETRSVVDPVSYTHLLHERVAAGRHSVHVRLAHGEFRKPLGRSLFHFTLCQFPEFQRIDVGDFPAALVAFEDFQRRIAGAVLFVGPARPTKRTEMCIRDRPQETPCPASKICIGPY